MIEFVGRDAIVRTPEMAFTYQVTESPRDFERMRPLSDNLNWNRKENYIGEYVVYPYGVNNDLPDIIKEAVQNNNLAPGIIEKKTQLLWGSGPKLYKEVIENRQIIRDWQENATVQTWLDKWDYESYLLQCSTDYQHLKGAFSRFDLARGSRVGQNFISRLHNVSPHVARLASLRTVQERVPTHVAITDWTFSGPASLDYKVYDLFDFSRPFAFKNSIMYSNMYSFCTDYYTVPELYGSLEWLRRSTAIPLILKALSKNSLNLKYHIISPNAYWEEQEKILQNRCIQRNVPYKEEYLLQFQEELLTKISKVLSGEENTGKYWHTTRTLEIDGNNLLDHGWEIKVIDQKIKDFVESQIAISDTADRKLSSGIGLHGALGNISGNGKSDSGSEQLYALKNYMATGVDIPEMIVMKAINHAIRANFPGLGLKMGFYHIQPEKEQDINPEQRLKNVV